AFLCIAIGTFPAPLYAILPYDVDYVPYTTTHVVTQLQLLFFSALAFTVLMRTGIYPPELKSVNLDADWTYRRFLPRIIGAVATAVAAVWSAQARFWTRRRDQVVARLFREYGPEGRVAQSAPTGVMVLWIAVFLGVTLIVNFLS
ncbi:MAG: Na(+)/H(+) antiporter subunit D, partial [Paracoccaceae bacterium]